MLKPSPTVRAAGISRPDPTRRGIGSGLLRARITRGGFREKGAAGKELLTLVHMLAVHARLPADRVGARNLERAMTFREWNDRSCRLANALLGLGLQKGDRVAVLAYNRVGWVEIYVAAAKAGLIVVPINFRLVGPEIRYVVENAEAGALIVEDALLGAIEEVGGDLPVPAGRLVHLGSPCPAGWRAYEGLITAASAREPEVPVAAA